MRLTLLVAVLLLPFGLAQEPPPVLTLPGALERGVVLNPEVIAARTALRAAERARARTTADPFALRLPKVRARHALENARSALTAARLAARAATESAYFGALEADAAYRSARSSLRELRRSLAFGVQAAQSVVAVAQDTLAAAAEALKTSEEALRAQRLRFEAGSISALELAQAELVVATGRAQARAARHALALERTALEQAVQGSAGSVPTLAPLLPVEGGLEEGN